MEKFLEKFVDKKSAMVKAYSIAKENVEELTVEEKDVQVVFSNDVFYVESPPELFIRSWEKVVAYYEVNKGSVRVKLYV